MNDTRKPTYRYVFVCGLHRTGTSLIARAIGSHPDISGIDAAPVPENEGCYLQGAIPHTALHGIPGHYATDPAQHLTEAHSLNSLETAMRIERDWDGWFDPQKPWRIEKSPVNLTRMRLLQALFPLAQFVIVTRHPAFMARALEKWSDDAPERLARYGVEAYRQTLADMPYLHAAMVVRYEDFVAAPLRQLTAVEAFLDLPSGMTCSAIRDGNGDYDAVPGDAGSIAALGYGVDGSVMQLAPPVSHPLRAVRERVLAVLAEESG